MYLYFMDIKEVISIDNEVLNGQPVFTGTRVPVESLFDHLEAGMSLDEFLNDSHQWIKSRPWHC